MMRYTWKRILTGIVSLFLLATVTFFLVRLIPGSPFQRGGVSEQVVEAVEEEYGLNDPLIEQYLSYMGNLLKGDLGISYQDPGTSVEEIIGRAAPLTVSLGLSALIVSVIVGTGCGVVKRFGIRSAEFFLKAQKISAVPCGYIIIFYNTLWIDYPVNIYNFVLIARLSH